MAKMNKKVDDYIDRQNSPQKEICRGLREIILEAYPDILEEMKWGVPSYLVEEDGVKDVNFYFVALKDKVHLGFTSKGLSDEQLKEFDGIGKETVHIRINSVSEIDEIRIKILMEMVTKG